NPHPMSHNRWYCFVLLAAFFRLNSPALAGSWDGVPPSFGLVWGDEFNGTVGTLPNSSNWNLETYTGGGNWNLSYCSPSYGTTNCQILSDPAATDGSALAIIDTDPGGNHFVAGNYHSATIDTKGLRQY